MGKGWLLIYYLKCLGRFKVLQCLSCYFVDKNKQQLCYYAIAIAIAIPQEKL